ncbi:MAG: DMT family transporter [Spirochaetes bacterium]|nr:DMT family transporter [Spirochaetota bacterium]HOV46803.1 DMT family transporter [Exilispira sp.]
MKKNISRNIEKSLNKQKSFQKTRILAIVALWIALFSWGIHGVAGRFLALDGVSMLGVMELRLIIGCVLFLFFLIITRNFDFSYFKFWKYLLPLSLIGLLSNSIVYHLGLKYIPATLVMLLENLSPFFVVLFAIIFDKKKPSITELISLIISFGGLVLIVIGKGGLTISNSEFYLGVICEVIAGITFGIYTYFSARFYMSKNLEISFKMMINILFQVFLYSAVAGIPFLFTMRFSLLQRIDIWLILEMGIFQSFLAYLLWNFALSVLPTSSTSILFYMTVVFTSINEIIFLKFIPNIIIIAGSILIICAAVLLTFKAGKTKTEKS